MHLKHGYIRFGCTKQLNLLVAFGWVGLGFVQIFSVVMGWVGLVQSADGLGWIGSQMDPWTTVTLIGCCVLLVVHACSLGADHDGQRNNCSSNTQNVMASKALAVNDSTVRNPYNFSSCSINSIHEHMDKLNAYVPQRSVGSRVVSVQDSGVEGPGFKSPPRRCRVTVLGKLFTPIVPLFIKQRNW